MPPPRVRKYVVPKERNAGEPERQKNRCQDRKMPSHILSGTGCDQNTSPRIQFDMEFRQLGKSGLQVPVLCLGTGTFGGGNEFFRAWGETDVKEATRLIDVCLEAGVNFFDTANVYSQGISE